MVIESSFIKRVSKLIISLITLLIVPNIASAAVIYDEAVSGDAGPSGSRNDSASITLGVDLGPLAPMGQFIVEGSVEGRGVDEPDYFLFSTLGDFTVDILSYVAGANNNNTGFELYLADGTSLNTSTRLGGLQIGAATNDIFDGIFGPGLYLVHIIEQGSSSPASYSFAINTLAAASTEVPLPAAAWLFVAGIGGLLTAQRKSQTTT